MKQIEITTPAEYADQFGVSLIDIIKITGGPRATITRWHKTKPMLYHALCVGVAKIKGEQHESY